MALLISDLGVAQATLQETLDADDFFNESFSMPLLTADEAEWLHKQQRWAQKERQWGSLAAAWIAEQEEIKRQVREMSSRIELLREVLCIDEATSQYEGNWPAVSG